MQFKLGKLGLLCKCIWYTIYLSYILAYRASLIYLLCHECIKVQLAVAIQFWKNLMLVQSSNFVELYYLFCDCPYNRISDPLHTILESILEYHLEHSVTKLGIREIIKRLQNIREVDRVCRNLFGNAGSKTVKLFRRAKIDNILWASTVGQNNADTVHKVLAMPEIIEFEYAAIAFLRSRPLAVRLRLLQSTNYQYHRKAYPINSDHLKQIGKLWQSLTNKPNLGRLRSWPEIHQKLLAELSREEQNVPLHTAPRWLAIDGLCAIDQSWELELPKQLSDLKYYGIVLHNCLEYNFFVYATKINYQQIVVLAVKQNGIVTCCLEISLHENRAFLSQFVSSYNGSPPCRIHHEICKVLSVARLITL